MNRPYMGKIAFVLPTIKDTAMDEKNGKITMLIGLDLIKSGWRFSETVSNPWIYVAMSSVLKHKLQR